MENKGLTPLPLTEAARLLAVSTRTIRRLVDEGELTAIRIGSTLAVPPDALPAPLRRALDGTSNQPLMTQHDAAARLGCSPRKVRALTTNGILRSVNVGRSPRWSPVQIEALRKKEASRDCAAG